MSLKIDELTLNSYVDGQLDPATRQRVLAAMEEDADLREAVCRLRRAKDWMQTGFATAEPRERPVPRVKKRFWNHLGSGMAASIIALGFGLGGGLAGYVHSGHGETADMQQMDTQHVLLHLDSADPEGFQAVLEYAEHVLNTHRHGDAQIDVVANAGGIDMMRKNSPFEKKMKALSRQYSNLHFIACANALRNLKAEDPGFQVVDGVDTHSTAIDHIVQRLQSGWRYQKVTDLPKVSL